MPTANPVVEDIVANVATTLSAISGLTVERNRDEDVTKFPTAIVFDGDVDSDESQDTGSVRHTLDLDVELWCQASTGALAGAAVNGLYAQIVAALQADHTRGGKAIDTQQLGRSFRLDKNEGGKALALSVVRFRIAFTTRPDDLTAVA